MNRPVKSPRRYRSAQRNEQARQTRRRILAAAQELFEANGYVATTMAEVAERAGVAVQTVYVVFKTKRGLLKELMDLLAVGDDEPVPLVERPRFREIVDEPDPERQVRLHVGVGRQIYERSGALQEVLFSAAGADPEVAEQWETNRGQREAVQRNLVRLLESKGGLRRDLSLERASDIYVALAGPETWWTLVGRHGWSPQEWEAWVGDILCALLLDPSPDRPTTPGRGLAFRRTKRNGETSPGDRSSPVA